MTNLIEYYRKKEDTDTNTITFERVKEKDIRICGKSLDEVITILQCLDIEHETGIKMTLANLNEYAKLYNLEQQKMQHEATEKLFKEYFKEEEGRI